VCTIHPSLVRGFHVYLLASLRAVWGSINPFWNPERTPWGKTHHKIMGRIYTTFQRRKNFPTSQRTVFWADAKELTQRDVARTNCTGIWTESDGTWSTLPHKNYTSISRGGFFSSPDLKHNSVAETRACGSTNKPCWQKQYTWEPPRLRSTPHRRYMAYKALSSTSSSQCSALFAAWSPLPRPDSSPPAADQHPGRSSVSRQSAQTIEPRTQFSTGGSGCMVDSVK